MNLIKKLIYKSKPLKFILAPLLWFRQLFIKKRHLKAKQMINALGEMMVGDPLIWVKEFNGKFNVDTKSDLFFRLITEKEYEPKLVKLCLKYLNKDRDVIDIGANIGFFTVLFANNLENGKVLSIEPTTKALRRLYKNIEINNVKNKVSVIEGVVSNHNGVMEIKTIEGKEEYSSIGNMKHPSVVNENWTTEKVVSSKLDDLVEQHSINPGFIKIDVEGAEHLVFEGAVKVLTIHRPIIISELNNFLLKRNGSSAKAVIELITSCNYDIYDPIDSSLKPGQKDFGDIICFPRELKMKFN